MTVLSLAPYKPVAGTMGDAGQIDNAFDAIVAAVNAIDNSNFAAGKIFDPSKIMQNAAVDADALIYDAANARWVPSSTTKKIPVGVANHSVLQSIASGVETTLAFDTDWIDTDAIHDTAVNNSRLTVKTAGIYGIFFAGSFGASAGGVRYGLVRKNGVTQVGPRFDVSTLGGGANGTIQGVTFATPIVGDYFELRVFQTSGGALNFDATMPAFGMVKIA